MSHLLYQLDLEGADSWTVAAECAALGDATMLEDLRAGVKPAQAVALLYVHGETVNQWSRAEIKRVWQESKVRNRLEEWLYPAAKSTTHGYCYGSGWMTTRDTILKYSMADLPLELGDAKPIALSKAEIEKLRACCALRYPGIALWHAKEGRDMRERGYLQMPTGHVRRFWGLKCEWKQGREQANHETLREWLASKPQYNTTYVLKLALHRLWHDGENRRDSGRWITCPKCSGTGHEMNDPVNICTECDGEKRVEMLGSVVPCSERSFEPVREVVGMITENKTTAELVRVARFRRKR